MRAEVAAKNLGDALASPVCSLLIVLSVSFSSLQLSSSVPWFYSPFPFFMDYSNGRLLQLIECIESIKSDVKKKMMCSDAYDPHTKVTRRR